MVQGERTEKVLEKWEMMQKYEAATAKLEAQLNRRSKRSPAKAKVKAKKKK